MTTFYKVNSYKVTVTVRDKEIKNAMFQIEQNNQEIRSQQEKIDSMTGIDKVITLENTLKEMKNIKEGLDKKIKT